MSTLEDLVKLRDFFEVHNWCQGDLSKWDEETRTRSWCLVGGVNACGASSLSVIQALNAALGVPFQYSLSRWNDYVAKTKDDVLALIDRAIENERLGLELVNASIEAATEKHDQGGYA